MKKTLLIVIAIASFISTVAQQKTDSSDKSGPKEAKSNQEAILFFNPDQSVITGHTTTIKGQKGTL
jgi:Ni/Co efflux regulator RcnB